MLRRFRSFDKGFSLSKWPYLLHKIGFVDSQSSSTVAQQPTWGTQCGGALSRSRAPLLTAATRRCSRCATAEEPGDEEVLMPLLCTTVHIWFYLYDTKWWLPTLGDERKVKPVSHQLWASSKDGRVGCAGCATRGFVNVDAVDTNTPKVSE